MTWHVSLVHTTIWLVGLPGILAPAGKIFPPPNILPMDICHFLNKKRAMLLSCSAAELTDTLGSEQMYSLNDVAEAMLCWSEPLKATLITWLLEGFSQFMNLVPVRVHASCGGCVHCSIINPLSRTLVFGVLLVYMTNYIISPFATVPVNTKKIHQTTYSSPKLWK